MKQIPGLIVTVVLFLNTSTMFAQNIEQITKEENKFIYSNSIKLFPGDSILVEPNNIDKKLTDFILKDVIADSTKTISIIFVYDKFGTTNASLLTVSNPFSKQLVYKARIRTRPASGYSETSIVPVYPKIFGIEMWPYKIESIILYDFELK